MDEVFADVGFTSYRSMGLLKATCTGRGWLHCGHRNLFTKLKEGPLLVNTYIHTSKLHLDRSNLSHT